MPELSLAEFADKVNEIIPVLLKEFSARQANELFKGKITLAQFFVLDLLEREGELKMSGLSRYMKVSTPAMTGIVERLVREHYLTRISDPQDRRVIRVRVTQKGSKLVKKIYEQRRSMIIRIFGRLSESDCRQYLNILTKIKETFTKEGAA
ncbi:MAG: MarR family transcriptional regulator [Candidatus Omnitrophica bacterium]|nr:MarR family transcriptional regulator [Candidatus Omnitrophota bacterium]